MPSSRPRPRRLLLTLLTLPFLFLFLLYLGSPASRRTLSDLYAQPTKLPDEIFGLLHFVTSPDEAGRVINAVGEDVVVPEKPVPMTWYALGSIAKAGPYPPGRRLALASAESDWDDRLSTLREQYPLIVFSKTYCPYSMRVKKLLEVYDLSPAPKIIEVDLRADASHIKTVLGRLTHRSTFPNVILQGHSLGGLDELAVLHRELQLRSLLQKAGVKVGRAGQDDEGDAPV